MKQKFLVFLSLMLCAGIASASPALTLTPLNKDQINELFKDSTMKVGPAAYHGKKLEADTVEVYFAPDGTMSGRWVKILPGVPQTDTGTWSVNPDGQTCVQWKNWGTNYCMYFYPLSNNYLMVTTNQEEALIIPKSSFTRGKTISR